MAVLLGAAGSRSSWCCCVGRCWGSCATPPTPPPASSFPPGSASLQVSAVLCSAPPALPHCTLLHHVLPVYQAQLIRLLGLPPFGTVRVLAVPEAPASACCLS